MKNLKVRDDIMGGIEAVAGIQRSQWVILNLNFHF